MGRKDRNYHFLAEEDIENIAQTFKVLSDPTRIKILHLLSQEECSVTHLAEVLGI